MWRLLFVLLLLSPGMGSQHKLSSRDARSEASIGCAPAETVPSASDAGVHFSPLFPGWGHYHYSISTGSDSAQYYFDQGLSLYYGYHLPEALASFREASLKDSSCAMTYWGQALAMGPYYNNTYSYKMPQDVAFALEKMNRLKVTAPARERDLAAAMNERYSSDLSDSRRPELNRAYSEAMKALIGKYPADKDIKALYVDGVMSEHAWDMYNPKGEPKPWTPELVRFCEEILEADAYHPAALHYHIHLIEASYHPEKTLASADKLKDLMPGVPHMVHMASHTYQRMGLYAKGAFINDSANAAQRVFVRVAGSRLGLSPDIIHYHAVEAYCALSGGMYRKASDEAQECRRIAKPRLRHSTTYLQYLYMMPVFVDIRMGQWQSILDRPVPDDSVGYAVILSDFARGLAFVRKGDVAAAGACLERIRAKKGDALLADPVKQGNPPVVGVAVAESILEGELLFAQGKVAESAAAFGRAIQTEDGMAYVEPKDWVLPARHFAGACMLKQGKAAEAEALYREDLVHNPGSGWALLGLAQSLDAQKKNGAAECRAKAAAAFAMAEVMPAGSAY